MAQTTTTVSEPPLASGGERAPRQQSLWTMALRRLLRNKLAIAGFAVIGVMTAATIAAPLIRRYDPYLYQNYDAIN